MTRTIKQALEHAEQQRQYPLREAPDLITDFILLADELNRLRVYGCNHPERLGHYTAFVSPEAAEKVWAAMGMMFEKTPIEIDPEIKDGRIHFPQGDGTCQAPNV